MTARRTAALRWSTALLGVLALAASVETAGQRDLTSAVMVLIDGTWKVSDIQGQADVSCDAAPTTQGLPTV